MVALYEKMQPQLLKVDKSDQSIWSFTWSITDRSSTNEWKMWVDVEHGFTPVRYENRECFLHQNSWWVIQTYQTKWSKQAGVWVPIRHEIVMTPNQGKWRQEIAFDVNWENINQSIKEDTFDYKGFGVPNNVSVVDVTLSQPVAIKSGVTPRQQVKLVKRKRDSRNIVLFFIGIAMLVIIVVYFLVFRRKKTVINESNTGNQEQ